MIYNLKESPHLWLVYLRVIINITLRIGFKVLMKSISCTKQSNLFLHFCLVYEMLFIRTLKPNLNVQSDSICAKVVRKYFDS